MIFALQDEHKLVRFQALCFWNLVIKKQLEHEGMIDGSFPIVTFSKVLKKIITFNDATVEKCLLRVLHKLREIGGLRVFIHIFEKENDDEVINAAIKDIDKFIQLLQKYNITFSSFMKKDPALYSSSDSNRFKEDVLSEILKLEWNCKLEHPTQSMCYRKNNQITIWDFLRNFENYCSKRARKDGRSDDLDIILSKLFVD